jgi:MFS family permease
MNNILRALNHRNYRLFFSGQLVSLIGTWMQQIAMSWLVYHLTNSAFMLGLITFFSQIPSFALSPFGGVFTDRWNKHKALIITQTLSMIQAFIIAILTLTKVVQVWHIIVLSLMLGFINAFDMPIRQAFVIEMIEDRRDLGNAIALNSTMVNGARLFGPAVAGLLVAAVGEGMCFLINAISFVAVIIALLFMKIKKPQIKIEGKNIFDDLKEGFKYSFGFIPTRDVFILIAIISLIGMPYTVLMPIFAKDVLKGGSDVLGFLMAASGVGALIGGIFLANRKSVSGLGKIMAIATLIFGIALVIFSLSKLLWLSIFILVFVGLGMILLVSASNTFLQTITDDEMRGRVMGYFAMAFVGISPFGSLIAGGLANSIGAPYTLMISGIIVIICSIIFYIRLPILRKFARPVYIKKGLIS